RRCRRDGAEAQQASARATSKTMPPANTPGSSQPPAVVHAQLIASPLRLVPAGSVSDGQKPAADASGSPTRPRDAALALRPAAPGLLDHRPHLLQLLRRDALGTQQAEDHLRRRPIKDPVEKPGGTVVAAEASRVDERPPLDVMNDQPLDLHDAEH